MLSFPRPISRKLYTICPQKLNLLIRNHTTAVGDLGDISRSLDCFTQILVNGALHGKSYYRLLIGNQTLAFSGVPRILELEGSRCRRRGGGVAWGGGIPLPTPSPLVVWEGKYFAFVFRNRIFLYFLLKIPQFDALILIRLFFKSYANGRGSNPLTPSSVRHC